MLAGKLKAKLRLAEEAPLNWPLPDEHVSVLPEPDGLPWLVFRDEAVYELGSDSTGARFAAIADRMLGGRYYPPDAVSVYGRFVEESRPIRRGDRLAQYAPLLGKWGGPVAWSSVEIFAACREAGECQLGYVTTKLHHGRGIWLAELSLQEQRLSLRVRSIACPHSWLFWLGLPVARYLQVRARRRAVEVFRSI